MKLIKMRKTGIASFCAAMIAGGGAANAQDTTGNVELEEIVVTGIRASLERADQVKENANSLVDGISAEDIGKFPDINVAESLQRITGVAITRSRGGEGQAVTVRGLGEEFNAVFYNGRLIATEAEGRQFNFDVIASELINSAQIYKSSEAVRPSGSLGGQINVQSAKPFDNPGFRSAFSAALQYDDLAEEAGPRVSGIVSNTWGNWGALASVAYQQRDIRNDIHETLQSQILDVDNNTGTAAPAGTLAAGPGIVQGARYSNFEQITNVEDRERIGGTFALQYQPSDEFNATFDVLYSKFESPGVGSAFGNFSGAAVAFEPGSVFANPDTGTITQANLRSSDATSVNIDILSRNTQAEAETVAVGTNFEWKPRDNFKLVGDLAYSTSDGSRSQLRTGGFGSGGFFIGLVRYAQIDYRTADGADLPTITVRVPDSRSPGDPNTFNPNANFVPLEQVPLDTIRSHFSRDDDDFVDDEILSARVDGTWEFNDTTSLDAGVYLTSQTKEISRFNNFPTQGTFANNANFLVDHDPEVFAAFVASGGSASAVPGDFLSDFSGGSGSSRFPFLPADLFRALLANDGLAADGSIAAAPGFSALDTAFRPANSNTIDEDVISAYVQVNHEGTLFNKPWRGNVGLRIEQTDVTSSGAISAINSFRPQGTQIGDGVILGTTPNTPVSVDNDYTEVLPSVNFAMNLQDNLILRAAFSTTLTRPTLFDLSTATTITRQNIGSEALSSGNPELNPTMADNFDLSLEYYGDNFVGSVALFHKDIDDFVTSGQTNTIITIPQSFAIADIGQANNLGPIDLSFQVTQPLNASSAEVSGIELAGRYQWDNGFGIGANITLVDSELVTGNVTADLDDVSDESYNIFAFYESDKIQTRIALNHRGEFQATATSGIRGRPDFVEDFTTIDASFSYQVNDKYQVYVEGINLTSENSRTFSDFSDFIRAAEDFGARYNVGIRGSF